MALTKITPQMFDTSAADHDFNIDNGTFVVDASANRVGIGTDTPSSLLHVNGALTATTIAGTLTTAAQTNITSVGTLTGLTSSADITATAGSNATVLTDEGALEIIRSASNGYIDFKTTTSEDYDCRIQQASNGFHFATGGQGSTSLALTLDSSQNATFAGTISSGSVTIGDSSTAATFRAHYSDGSYMDLHGYGLSMARTNSYIRPSTDGDKILYIGAADDSLDWQQISFRSTAGLYLNGTQFIDASRNLVNIGTVASGAINVSPGTITATHGASITNQTNMQLALRDSDNINMRANFMVEKAANGNRGGLAIQATEAGVSNDRDLYLQPSGGRVGILKSSPTEALHVGGSVALFDSIIRIPDGSNAAPSLTFANDTDTGILRVTTNALGITAAGSRKFYVNATNAYFQNLTQVQIDSGNFYVDGHTGLRIAADSNHALKLLQSSTLTHGAYFQINGGSATGLEINATAGSISGTALLVQQSNVTSGGFLARFANSSGNQVTIGTDGTASFAGTIASGNINVTGNVDASNSVLVGTNNSYFAENVIRFKPSGAAYFDHNTTGQHMYFRTSVSSTLDTTVMQVGGDGYVYIRGLRINGADGSVNQIWQSTSNAMLGISANGGDINFGQTSSSIMRLKPTGRVGIGPTDPTEKLEVYGSINTTYQSNNFATGSQRGFIDMIGSSKIVRIGSLSGAATPTGSQGGVDITVNNSTTARFDANGNLFLAGIGNAPTLTHKTNAAITAAQSTAGTWSATSGESGTYSARGALECAGIYNRHVFKFAFSGNLAANTWYPFVKRSELTTAINQSGSGSEDGFAMYFRIYTYLSSAGYGEYGSNRLSNMIWINNFGSNSTQEHYFNIGPGFGHAPNGGDSNYGNAGVFRLKVHHHLGTENPYGSDQTIEFLSTVALSGLDATSAAKTLAIYGYVL